MFNRRGPDDLWEWPEFSWVIEAKNEGMSKLPKADGEQLLAAMQWFKGGASMAQRVLADAAVAEAGSDRRLLDG